MKTLYSVPLVHGGSACERSLFLSDKGAGQRSYRSQSSFKALFLKLL